MAQSKRFNGSVCQGLLCSTMGSHMCPWTYTCGAGPSQMFVLNNSNGLPVELMGFSVEDGDETETETESQDAGP